MTMVVTGFDAIQKFKTREISVDMKDNLGVLTAKITMARLPIDELINYYSLFEKLDKDNPNSMFSRTNVERIMGYMTSCIMTSNPDIEENDVREFVATNFMALFEPFTEVNGGGASVDLPDDVKRQIDEAKQ